MFILPTADVQIVWYAKQWLRASDAQIGLLYASDGIGVVVFSLLTNRLRKRWSFGVVALGSMMVLGLLTALMACTHWYPFALVIWAFFWLRSLSGLHHLVTRSATCRRRKRPKVIDTSFTPMIRLGGCLPYSAST